MVQITLIAPDGGPRVLPALSALGLPDVVQHGDVIDVPPELAGEPPRWRRVKDDADPLHPSADPSKFFDRRELAGKSEVYDLGFGLLAQTDVWALSGQNSEG